MQVIVMACLMAVFHFSTVQSAPIDVPIKNSKFKNPTVITSEENSKFQSPILIEIETRSALPSEKFENSKFKNPNLITPDRNSKFENPALFEDQGRGDDAADKVENSKFKNPLVIDVDRNSKFENPTLFERNGGRNARSDDRIENSKFKNPKLDKYPMYDGEEFSNSKFLNPIQYDDDLVAENLDDSEKVNNDYLKNPLKENLNENVISHFINLGHLDQSRRLQRGILNILRNGLHNPVFPSFRNASSIPNHLGILRPIIINHHQNLINRLANIQTNQNQNFGYRLTQLEADSKLRKDIIEEIK